MMLNPFPVRDVIKNKGSSTLDNPIQSSNADVNSISERQRSSWASAWCLQFSGREGAKSRECVHGRQQFDQSGTMKRWLTTALMVTLWCCNHYTDYNCVGNPCKIFICEVKPTTTDQQKKYLTGIIRNTQVFPMMSPIFCYSMYYLYQWTIFLSCFGFLRSNMYAQSVSRFLSCPCLTQRKHRLDCRQPHSLSSLIRVKGHLTSQLLNYAVFESVD